MKTALDYFNDWEGHVFGFGYGSGENHTIPALRSFLADIPAEGAYDYRVLEAAHTPTVAWLFINALCKCDVLEYGTSPRFAWLTKEGRALREFMLSVSIDDLLVDESEDYTPCYPDYCNCHDEPCHNPFWKSTRGQK